MKCHSALAVVLLSLALPGIAHAQTGGPAFAGTPGQQAGKLYDTAMSQMRANQLQQAGQLLEQFVKLHPTHEYVPVAYLQVAYCRQAAKDAAGMAAPLEEVIRRFPGTLAWQIAYAVKLGQACKAGQRDKYLQTVEEMLKQCPQAPMTLTPALVSEPAGYYKWAYQPDSFEQSAFRMGSIGVGSNGWIMDVARMADTPERADRALKALAPTLRARAKDLPLDWQMAQVFLLRRAGKAEEADKALDDWVQEWGDDARGINLLLLQAAWVAGEKDPAALDAVWDRLIEKYDGRGSLEGPLYNRVMQLGSAGRYEQFTALARKYVKTYGMGRWQGPILAEWVRLAQPGGPKKDDLTRVQEAMESVNGATGVDSLARRQFILNLQVELNRRLGLMDQAAECARALMTAHWSAEVYGQLKSWSANAPAIEAVLAEAEAKRAIPAADPNDPAAGRLKELKGRLKEDQARHAEEIGELLFSERPNDAATIEAVRDLAVYYHGKVVRDMRDKWTERMLKTYPYHPLTQGVLQAKIAAASAEKRSPDLAEVIDVLMERFPGARDQGWYVLRLGTFDAANDPAGKLEFVRMIYGKLAEAGDISAIDEIGRYEEPNRTPNRIDKPDFKGGGDYWMAWAGKFPNTRTAVHCQVRAFGSYYLETAPPGGFWQNRGFRPLWPQAMEVTAALRSQQVDPEVRWRMEFAEVNLLAQQGQGAKALKALDACLDPKARYRDLSLRLDMRALGQSLVADGAAGQAGAVLNKLTKLCQTKQDRDAVEVLQASSYAAAKQYANAARCHLRIVDRSPWPALEVPSFNEACGLLEQAAAPDYPGIVQAYLAKIPAAQDLAPDILLRLGAYQVRTKNPAVMQVRQVLAGKYPASSAVDKLDTAIGNAK